MKLTTRQAEVLDYVRRSGPVGSGSEGSILHALARKGLVVQHFNSAPGYVYYTWTAASPKPVSGRG
jgi:hypothetical protein